VPELQEDAPAGLVDRVGHFFPALDLFVGMDAGRARVALALRRHLGGLTYDEGGIGALPVVRGVHLGGHVARRRPVAGERRHRHAVRKREGPEVHVVEEGRSHEEKKVGACECNIEDLYSNFETHVPVRAGDFAGSPHGQRCSQSGTIIPEALHCVCHC